MVLLYLLRKSFSSSGPSLTSRQKELLAKDEEAQKERARILEEQESREPECHQCCNDHVCVRCDEACTTTCLIACSPIGISCALVWCALCSPCILCSQCSILIRGTPPVKWALKHDPTVYLTNKRYEDELKRLLDANQAIRDGNGNGEPVPCAWNCWFSKNYELTWTHNKYPHLRALKRDAIEAKKEWRKNYMKMNAAERKRLMNASPNCEGMKEPLIATTSWAAEDRALPPPAQQMARGVPPPPPPPVAIIGGDSTNQYEPLTFSASDASQRTLLPTGGVEEFLERAGCSEYASGFRKEGFELIEDVKAMEREDLVACGVTKGGHLKRLMRGIELMRG